MRILVISKEAWRDEQNGGNVLTNLFKSFNAEFAQIYCTESEPNNPVCKKYYQITDRMMVESIKSSKRAGARREYIEYPKTSTSKQSFSGSKKYLSGEFVRIMREVVWKLGKWDKEGICSFVREFNPDLVFAPCYGNHYMHKLTQLVYNELHRPIVSYISDDHYTNNQLRFSPLYWLNHFILRKHTRAVFKLYTLCYTMTEEQKEQCKRDFGANMKILRKSGLFESQFEKKCVSSPIRFVYGGGIYLNRYKTLQALATAMKKINEGGVKMTLDIYTNNELPSKDYALLNDGTTSRMHGAVSMAELRDIYHQSDVALHCEGFDLQSQYTVRLSFSTKIIDCMDSGCAVMAICDEKQAGGAYLRRNDCAICVNDLNKLSLTLRKILDNPQMLVDLQHKAFDIGRKYHLQNDIQEEILEDFNSVINGIS